MKWWGHPVGSRAWWRWIAKELLIGCVWGVAYVTIYHFYLTAPVWIRSWWCP